MVTKTGYTSSYKGGGAAETGDVSLNGTYGLESSMGEATRGGKLTLRPLSLEEALDAALRVGPPEKPARKGRSKFAMGDRVIGSDKAPTRFQGKHGTVSERGPQGDYGVQFDGGELEFLNSGWLDRE